MDHFSKRNDFEIIECNERKSTQGVIEEWRKVIRGENNGWALDSALDALSREDKKTFMNRVFDMSVASNLDQMDILYIFAQTAYSTSLLSSFIFGGHK